jgi:hypothetical protein
MNGGISTGLNLVSLALSRSKDGRRLMLASWIVWLFLAFVKKLRAKDLFNLAYLTKLDQSGFIDQLYASK